MEHKICLLRNIILSVENWLNRKNHTRHNYSVFFESRNHKGADWLFVKESKLLIFGLCWTFFESCLLFLTPSWILLTTPPPYAGIIFDNHFWGLFGYTPIKKWKNVRKTFMIKMESDFTQ